MFSDIMIAAAALVLGIVMTHTLGMSAAIFCVLFLFLLFFVRTAAKREFAARILAICAVFSFGLLRYCGAAQDDLYRKFPDKYVTITGVVESLPLNYEDSRQNRYILNAEALEYGDNSYSLRQKLLLGTDESFDFGDIVTVSGFLTELDGINNEYEHDYSLSYKSKGISNRLNAYEASKIDTKHSIAPAFIAGKARQEFCRLADKYFTADRAAFLKAIVVGNSSGFSRSYNLLLVRTGMKRALSSSYMHVSLIAIIAGIFCSSKKNRDFLTIILLALYAVTNSGSPVVVKAAAFGGVLLFKRAVFGFADKLDTLSLVVLVMIAADPMLCFNGGFVMSVVSAVIMYLSFPPIYDSVYTFLAKRRIKSQKLSGALSVWFIFTVGTLPFSAFFYNGQSIFSTFVMTLLMPLTALLSVGSVMLFFTLKYFGATPVFGITDGILCLLEKVPYLIEKIPYHYIPLKTPTISELLLFLLGWVLFIRCISGKAKTFQTCSLAAAFCGLALATVNIYGFNTLSIYFVNVGQGDGAVLSTTAGDTVIIDGGGSAVYEGDYNIGEAVYLPYLVSHGFTDVDAAIVSHYHKDHVEGIIAAAENLKIDTLIMPNCAPSNQYRKKLEELATEKNINVRYLMEGDEIRFKSGLNIKFLAPDSDQLKSSDLNDTSFAAEIRYGEFCALFTGDSTDKINDSYPEDVDILKVAHHGSNTGSLPDYVEHTSPEYAVVSVGDNNPYSLPSKTVLQRLKNEGAKILRTDKLGDIRFKVKKSGKTEYTALRGG